MFLILIIMSDDIFIPGQQYLDDHGTRGTVTGTEENRVIFIREGYHPPCMRPLYNFMSKFHLIQNPPLLHHILRLKVNDTPLEPLSVSNNPGPLRIYFVALSQAKGISAKSCVSFTRLNPRSSR